MTKILKFEHLDGGKLRVFVSIEGLRQTIYFAFYIVVAVGVILTTLFADVNWEHNLIKATFGVNNICLNFDFAPAIYVLPFLWALTLVVMVIERLSVLLRIWISAEDKYISSTQYYVLTVAIVYQILSFAMFSISFAVQPHDLHTLRIHTVPYTNLVVALAVMALTNLSYAQSVGYDGFDFPWWVQLTIQLYVVLLIAVSIHQVTNQSFALINGHAWEDAPFPLSLPGGTVWLVLVIILPPAWNAYLNHMLRDKSVQICMDLSLTVGGVGGHAATYSQATSA